MANERIENNDMAQQKEVAYYSSLLNAWIGNRTEIDRSLLAISSGAIGLLATLFYTGSKVSVSVLWLLSSSIILFLLVIIIILWVFNINASLVSNIIKRENSANEEETKSLSKLIDTKNKQLGRLDKTIIRLFILGLVLALVAVGVSYKSISEEEEVTTMIRTDNSFIPPDDGSDSSIDKSLEGLDSLSPSEISPSSGSDDISPGDTAGPQDDATADLDE